MSLKASKIALHTTKCNSHHTDVDLISLRVIELSQELYLGEGGDWDMHRDDELAQKVGDKGARHRARIRVAGVVHGKRRRWKKGGGRAVPGVWFGEERRSWAQSVEQLTSTYCIHQCSGQSLLRESHPGGCSSKSPCRSYAPAEKAIVRCD